MIFVTIGTQEPFDRLIKVVDEIALLIDMPIIAQVSNTSYQIENIKTLDFVSPIEFNKLMSEADLIISHAGMGTIISALQIGKPIIVMPRIAKMGEHRNEHQMATAKKMESLKYIHVAYTEEELKTLVLTLINTDKLKLLHFLGDWASDSLISSLKNDIDSIN